MRLADDDEFVAYRTMWPLSYGYGDRAASAELMPSPLRPEHDDDERHQDDTSIYRIARGAPSAEADDVWWQPARGTSSCEEDDKRDAEKTDRDLCAAAAVPRSSGGGSTYHDAAATAAGGSGWSTQLSSAGKSSGATKASSSCRGLRAAAAVGPNDDDSIWRRWLPRPAVPPPRGARADNRIHKDPISD